MIKTIKIKGVCTVVLMLFLFLPIFDVSNRDIDSKFSSENINLQNTRVLYSYEDVFKRYYTLASSTIEEAGFIVPFTIEEFQEGFQSRDYDISVYTDYVIEQTIEGRALFSSVDENAGIMLTDSSSADADYILNYNTNPDFSSSDYFKRKPVYNDLDFYILNKGDIVYETNTILDVGHTAIVSTTSHLGYYGRYVQTIEAVASGVRYGFLDDTRIAQYEVLILRPLASVSQRENAVEFASRQIGKPYSLNTLRLNTDINSEKWYCSELCYASYYYAGVDIGMYFAGGLSYALALGCIPSDIYRSSNTYVKGLVSEKYLDIQIYDYINQSGYWLTRVFNNTGLVVDVSYNQMMCFADDAESWTGLNHLHSVTLSDGAYSEMKISQNLLATTIVFGYEDLTTELRYITYANQLSKLNYTDMTTYYVTLGL